MNVVFITLISLSVVLLCSASTDVHTECVAGEPSIKVTFIMTLNLGPGGTQDTEIDYDLTLNGKTSDEAQSVIDGLIAQHGNTTVITCKGGLNNTEDGTPTHCVAKPETVCGTENICDNATTECVDTFGCYMCQCKSGFNSIAANSNGTLQCEVACEPNPCTDKAFQTCDASSGSAECVCEEGYERADANKPCIPMLTSDCQTLLDALTPTNIPGLSIQSNMLPTEITKYEEYYAMHRRVPLELYEDGMCTDATVNSSNPVALTAGLDCKQVESYKAFKMAFAAANGEEEVELFELSTGYQIFKIIECDEECSESTLTCTQTRTRHQALVVDDTAVVHLRDVYLPGGCELRLTMSP